MKTIVRLCCVLLFFGVVVNHTNIPALAAPAMECYQGPDCESNEVCNIWFGPTVCIAASENYDQCNSFCSRGANCTMFGMFQCSSFWECHCV